MLAYLKWMSQSVWVEVLEGNWSELMAFTLGVSQLGMFFLYMKVKEGVTTSL